MTTDRNEWRCSQGCGEPEWAHELYDDACPPPTPPNECCGANGADDVARLCVEGCCTEWFCSGCGLFTKTSAGPVLCPCLDHRSWSRRHPEQRARRAVPSGARHHRRYRARRGRS